MIERFSLDGLNGHLWCKNSEVAELEARLEATEAKLKATESRLRELEYMLIPSINAT